MTHVIVIGHNGSVARTPGRFEQELIAFLCDHPALTSKEIHERFGAPRGYVRGTTIKALDRLTKKGGIQRHKVKNTFVYSTTIDRTELEQGIIRAFIEERLGGRIEPIAAYLVRSELLTRSELESIISRDQSGE